MEKEIVKMTLEDAQKQVDNWIGTYGVRYFNELTNMALLTDAFNKNLVKKIRRNNERHKNNLKL